MSKTERFPDVYTKTLAAHLQLFFIGIFEIFVYHTHTQTHLNIEHFKKTMRLRGKSPINLIYFFSRSMFGLSKCSATAVAAATDDDDEDDYDNSHLRCHISKCTIAWWIVCDNGIRKYLPKKITLFSLIKMKTTFHNRFRWMF